MIPIKIGDKRYKVKTIDELTTKEFIELNKIDELTIIKYIAWQTSTSLDKAFFAYVNKSVEQAIGVIPDITKMKPCKKFDLKKTIQTIGQRHQVEGSNLNNYELLVFCLAVSQAQSNNIDDVLTLRDSYLAMPFYEILPTGFFFFKNLRHGRNLGQRILTRFINSIRTRRLKKRLGLKS